MNKELGLINSDISNEDEIMLRAEKFYENVGISIPKRLKAIESICDELVVLTPAKQEFYITEISKKLKIPKKQLDFQLKEFLNDKKPEKVKSTPDSQMGVPHITLVENFISDHYHIRYNVVANRIEMANKTSGKDNKEPSWEEFNPYNILRKLKKAHFRTSQTEIIEIVKSDFTPWHNPFVEYFKNLPEWDGEDHIQKLGSYLTIEGRNRFERMFRKMFVRSVACALEQNFNKQVFTFVGKGEYNQNMGKSTFIRKIVPPALVDYYTEEIPKDKDAVIALTENFIINLDELSTLNRMEINWLKSMLSKDKAKVRVPYDSRTSMLKRRCSFMASTNEAKFLTDLTGNVRWICFNIKDIDFNYDKDIDFDQVWSQAYHYLTKGINGKKFNYQLTREEIEENEKANREFMNLPAEMELIPRYYAPATKENHQAFYTASDFVKSLTEKTNGAIRFYSSTVGKALRSLGFSQSETRTEGSLHPVKGYYVNFLTPDIQEEKDNPPY